MIIEIKRYFAQHKLVNSRQLSQHFAINMSALEPMLQHWLHKGLIKTYQPCQQCQSSCQSCTAVTQWYQWCTSE